MGFGVLDRAAGTKGGFLDRVADRLPEAAAVSENGLDAIGLIGHGEDDVRDTCGPQEVELMP
jgi:hypothetical protein